MIIKNTKEPFESGEKRFYMQGVVIEEGCPKCGKLMSNDYGQQYLSYPMFNEAIEIGFYCPVEGCDGEATRTIILRLDVKEVV